MESTVIISRARKFYMIYFLLVSFSFIICILFCQHSAKLLLQEKFMKIFATNSSVRIHVCSQSDYYSVINEYLSDRRKFLISSNFSLSLEQMDNIATETGIEKGGIWKPKDCKAKYESCLVVPYRNRSEHLPIFLTYIHEFLQLQNLNYRIMIVEQSENGDFNRGKLMNVGFSEMMENRVCGCFIFHDVDFLPENIENTYACTSHKPRHMSAARDKTDYKLNYERYIGGVLSISDDLYKRVNGFSNRYWGWGKEDDDFHKRLNHYGINITRWNIQISRYTTLKHKQAEKNDRNNEIYRKYEVLPFDGLSNLNYEVICKREFSLYTWIKVDIMK